MKKVALVLSGCGVFDGAEIHESVLAMLVLDKKNALVEIFAPDMRQRQVINHFSGEEMSENRNVLVEAARIARGNIKNLADANASSFDALIFPGGLGVAKNFCDFAIKGSNCTVDPIIKKFIIEGLKAKRTMGFICIAPALLAKITENLDLKLKLTIGSDEKTAQTLTNMGAQHLKCEVNDIVVDQKNKIVTTPAYMLGKRISEVYEGIEKLVNKVLALC